MTKQNQTTIAVIGAGGKMGGRLINNLVNHDYQLLLCENGEKGIQNLTEKGSVITDTETAVQQADVIILAVPDTLIGRISADIVPQMKPNATIILLDPAAAYANQVKTREDCTFVVTHPCHPPLFGEQETPEARQDMFGGIAAKQDIVIALHYGSEENFTIAEEISIQMFAPVVNCYRMTVEHMAILEPTAAEVVAASAAVIMKEAYEQSVKLGVPEEAARSFLLGHIQIPLAIVFNNINPFSDAAKVAIDYGYEKIFKEDWKQVFTKESLDEVIGKMLELEEKKA